MTDEKVFTQFNPQNFFLNFTLASAEKELRLLLYEQRPILVHIIPGEPEKLETVPEKLYLNRY